MTSSLNSRKISIRVRAALLFGCAGVFAGVFYTGVAGAQEKPRSLVPSFVEKQVKESPNSAAEDLFNPLKEVNPASRTSPPLATDSQDMVVQSLDAIHPGTIGLLSAAQGGFGNGMWQGMSSELAATLVEKLAVPNSSLQMSDLYRRLLLSMAAMPDTKAGADRLLDARFDHIRQAGWLDDAATLFARLPANALTPARQKYGAELNLLRGQEADACAAADRQKEDASPDSFWTKLDIYCRLRANDLDRAELGAALLEDQGEDDALFFTLFAALAGDAVDISKIAEPLTALHLAMLRKLDTKFPVGAARISGLDIKKAMMQNKDRLGLALSPVAKMLAAANSLDVAAFNENVDQKRLADTAITSPAQIAEGAADTAQDASLGAKDFLTQLVELRAAVSNEEKAVRLSALWDAARQNGDLFAVSTLTLPELEALPVGGYGAEFNYEAVKMLLLHQRVPKALQWERAARRAASQGTAEERLAARSGIARLDMYVLLSGAKGIAKWNRTSFPNWVKILANDPEQGPKAAFLLSVMEVFGYSVSEENWDSLLYMDQPLAKTMSNHALENNLVMAAVQKFTGKTVALALLALGNDGPDKVSLTTLRAVTSALKAVGLEQEARQLAFEVAILKGL